ncbi:MAG TPA: histidine kinase, partial [Parafilimonas sp.]|nr:histidine kinase [Parafilimonas sp.]
LLATANATHSRQYIRDGNWLQWKIYDEKKNTDSAYKYRLQYDIMNDSIVQDELTRNLAVTQMKFNDEQKQSQIDLLKKDNQISQQQLKNESLQKNLLISGILVITILGSVILRTIVLKRKNEKLENEQKQSALQNKTVELEMQALRSQMNPHFIFNSLNSINRFILQNERKQASAYITKFSKLIRLILQNSQSALIPLDSELESLNLYLDLEALRFNYHFDYKISVPENLDVSALQVPPLILQPYTENAIWHGLMHKEEKGHLDIEVSEENNQLLFKITDDGIGRKQAAMFASKSATKHKSMGLQITESRIAIMQRDETAKTSITIHDLVNADGSGAGTEVVIKLPVIYD